MSISARILRLLMLASVLLALWSPGPSLALAGERAAVPAAPLAQPDLVVTDIWDSGGSICYQVMNAGDAPAGSGHKTELDVDGNPLELDEVTVNMAPGTRLNRCFSYSWQCSDQVDIVVVWADSEFVIAEPDENNNGVKEIWSCDVTSPSITSGPDVSSITTESALISWVTDEKSDSLVKYGRWAGVYEGQASDATLSKDHELTLQDLKPWSTYHYVVQSSDAAGNTVTSDEAFFETLPLPDSARPSISDVRFTRGPGDFLYYDFEATVTDDVGVERVEFLLDGTLIGTDYAPMTTTLTPVYEVALIPSAAGFSREEFFQEHTVEVVAIDAEGFTDAPSTFDPPHECAAIDMHFIAPDPERTFYMEGPVAELMFVPMTVYAAEVTKQCEAGSLILPGWGRHDPCQDDLNPVLEVNYYVNTIWECFDPSPAGDSTFSCEWNGTGLGPGTFTMRADAYLSDGCQQTVIRRVTLAIGERRLEVVREVTRIDNYFEVELTVQNLGTLAQEISAIEDSAVGFQPVDRWDAAGSYEVVSDCSPDGQACDVTIDVGTEGAPYIFLQPGEEISVYYEAVPVLHPVPFEYSIGAEPVRVLDPEGAVAGAFERPCAIIADDTELSRAVPLAQEASDYLIVTNPGRLYDLYAAEDVNDLLSAMADLARLKDGILGYLSGPDATDARDVDDQIEAWGSTMRGSYGVPGKYLSNGYLLIVGEIEVVPARRMSYANLPFDWGYGDIDSSDMYYASTDYEYDRPNLSIGRIIGNTADRLLIPLQTSLDIANGEVIFDNSHAYAVAGCDTEDHYISLVDLRDWVADSLTDEGYTVEVSNCPNHPTFFSRAENRDAIFLAGHGLANYWSGFWSGDILDDFAPGDARPLVYAMACLTGRYTHPGGRSFAEAFLESGASAYSGATEVAIGPWPQRLADAFFDRLEVGKTVGKALRDAKRRRWGANTWAWDRKYNHYACSSQELFGDPKLKPTAYGPDAPEPEVNLSSALLAPVSPMEIIVPQYEVTHGVEGDIVEIPGGGMVLEPGQPSVPSYSVLVEYPPGQRVQEVSLTSRGGMQTDLGLDIPAVFTSHFGQGADQGQPAAADLEWWPDRNFHWTVHDDPDGSTTLNIEIYPFFYHSASTNVEFYTDYTFDVEMTTSPVEIKLLRTDEDAYPQGDDVVIDLWLSNTGQAQDVVVDVVVKDEGDNEVVDGLALRTLHDLEGSAAFTRRWNSGGHEPGTYTVEAEVRDAAGNLLDREVTRIRLGISLGHITNFSATPVSFEIGEGVDIALGFMNDGTVPISGTVVIQVQDETGETAGQFNHDIVDLAPGAPIAFLDEWGTENAQEGRYRVLGYVAYDATATEPAITYVSTNPPLFLPVILKSYR